MYSSIFVKAAQHCKVNVKSFWQNLTIFLNRWICCIFVSWNEIGHLKITLDNDGPSCRLLSSLLLPYLVCRCFCKEKNALEWIVRCVYFVSYVFFAYVSLLFWIITLAKKKPFLKTWRKWSCCSHGIVLTSQLSKPWNICCSNVFSFIFFE